MRKIAQLELRRSQTHLSSNEDDLSIRRPRQCECLSTDIETAHARLRSYIPKSHSAITGAAGKFRISNRVEEHFLDARGMAAQISRVFHMRSLWVPDSECTIRRARRN